jgi:hypothetical protein
MTTEPEVGNEIPAEDVGNEIPTEEMEVEGPAPDPIIVSFPERLSIVLTALEASLTSARSSQDREKEHDLAFERAKQAASDAGDLMVDAAIVSANTRHTVGEAFDDLITLAQEWKTKNL